FHVAMVDQPVLRQMAVGRDRLWFSRQAEFVALSSENFAACRQRADEVGIAPLVVHSRDVLLGKAPVPVPERQQTEVTRIRLLPPAERVVAETVSYQPAELAFRVHSPAAGW